MVVSTTHWRNAAATAFLRSFFSTVMTSSRSCFSLVTASLRALTSSARLSFTVARHPKFRIPVGGILNCIEFWGFHGTFESSSPDPGFVRDPAPFHPKKHVIWKIGGAWHWWSALMFRTDASIRRAGCTRGIVGVFWHAIGATTPRSRRENNFTKKSDWWLGKSHQKPKFRQKFRNHEQISWD